MYSGPQCENGYTKIANELLEALAKIRIPGEANQIMLAIIRQTYGFCKKSDCISISKFEEITGLSRRSVRRGIDKLVEMNIVRKKAHGFVPSYEINKHFDTWKLCAKKRTVRKNAHPPAQKRAQNYAQKSAPQKKERNYTKETTTGVDEKYLEAIREKEEFLRHKFPKLDFDITAEKFLAYVSTKSPSVNPKLELIKFFQKERPVADQRMPGETDDEFLKDLERIERGELSYER